MSIGLSDARLADFILANTALTRPSLVPEIALYLASSVTPLWHATEASMEEARLPPPYWSIAWPGGQVLARLLLDRPERARGRRALDLAAGSGIAGIAAMKSGAASVAASEIDGFAAAAIRLNAAINGVAVEIRHEDLLNVPAGAYDLILAGDLCYEKPMAARVFAWLSKAAAAGAEVLIADPGRSYLPAAGLIELARYDVPTSRDVEGGISMSTAIYRVTG